MNNNELKKLDREFHHETAEDYDFRIDRKFKQYHDLYFQPIAEKWLQQNNSIIVIDIGCGTGSLSIRMAQMGFHVIALDHSIDMLEIAKKKSEQMGVRERILFIIGDAENICFKKDTFHYMTIQGVIHHIVDIDRMLDESFSIMKQDSSVFISEPIEIFHFFRIMTFLSRIYHFYHGEKSIEQALLADDLIHKLKNRNLKLVVLKNFYIPFINIKLFSKIRDMLISFISNKKIGNLIFIEGKVR